MEMLRAMSMIFLQMSDHDKVPKPKDHAYDKFLIVILGPTAIGKTEFAISLAEKIGSEIISADSRQFYQELKIGVASPTVEQLARINHHFVGHLSIHNNYNVSKYETEVLDLL